MSNHNIIHARPRLLEAVLAIAVACLGIAGANLKAEVIFDGTLGTPGSIAGPDFQINADRGSQVGSNLFHSFSQFNLANTESATFNGPAAITNVISRVTGGNLSTIDGGLNVAIPQANLYLINPAGVVLGPNATLNIDGAFNVSTAHYLLLENGGRFDVMNSQQSVLTVGNPVAYGFLDTDIAGINVEGPQLQTAGYSMSVTGGNINVESATVNTQGGDVQLVAVSGPGSITIGQNGSGAGTAPTLANITIADESLISTSGNIAGSIYIRGGQLVIDNSQVTAGSDGVGDGGAIDVTVSNYIMDNGSELSTSTISDARSGEIRITAEEAIRIENGSVVASNTLGDGDAGDIDIRARRVELLEGGRIESTTGLDGAPDGQPDDGFAFVTPYNPTEGNSGDVTLTADTIVLSDSLFWKPNSFGWYLEKNGQTALLDMILQDLNDPRYFNNLDPDDQVAFEAAFNQWAVSWQTDTSGLRNQIIRRNVASPSGVITSSFSEGDAGNISVIVSDMEILGRSRISSRTDKLQPDVDEDFNQSFNLKLGSDGGDIDIVADTLTVRSHGQSALDVAPTTGFEATLIFRSQLPRLENEGALEVQYQAGIYADARNTTGRAGSIMVDAGEINIENGALVRTTTDQAGAGGDITLSAESISLDGTDASKGDRWVQFSMINAGTVGDGGDAGSITVNAQEIDVADGFVLSASTDGQGNAGNIEISGDRISLINEATVSSSSTGSGNGGSISIMGDKRILITGKSLVSSNTTNDGDAGSIDLEAPLIEISDGSQLTTTTGNAPERFPGAFPEIPDPYIPTFGKGGDITLTAEALVLLDNISTISSSTTGDGDAGSIKITANRLDVLNGSRILSTAGKPPVPTRPEINASITGFGLQTFSEFPYVPSKGNAGNIEIAASKVIIEDQPFWKEHSLLFFVEQEGSKGYADQLRQMKENPDYYRSLTDEEQVAFNDLSDVWIPLWEQETSSIRKKIGSENLREPSGLFTSSYAEGDAGDITINAVDIQILGKAQVVTNTFRPLGGVYSFPVAPKVGSDGGDIKLITGSLTIRSHGKDSLSYIRNSLETIIGGSLRRPLHINDNAGLYSDARLTTGKAGNIDVEANTIRIENGAAIQTQAQDSSAGGDINMDATAIFIEGNTNSTGILAPLTRISAKTTGTGDAGNIMLNAADTLTITGNKSIITAATEGDGNSGRVLLEARSVNLQDGARIETTTSSNGLGGTIEIIAKDIIQIQGQGTVLSASTAGNAQAGNVEMRAGESIRLSDKAMISTNTTGDGDAGATTIEAPSIEIAGDSRVTSTTAQGTGTGGTIDLHAASTVSLSGANTGLSAESFGAGNGGNIKLSGRRVNVKEGAGLSTAGYDEGAGGTIMIDARKVVLSAATIESQSAGSDAGGAIRIEGGDLIMDKGTIIRASNTGDGDAGSVELVTSDAIRIRNSEVTTEAVAGGGGKITLLTRKLLKLDHAILSTSVLGGDGSAGNIFIDPELVVLKNSVIRANAVQGDGGNINIQAGLLLQDANTLIDASSEYGIDGSIVIDAPVIQLQSKTRTAKKVVKRLLRNRCKARVTGNSSFTVTASAPSIPGPQSSLVAVLSDITNNEQGVTNRGYAQLAALSCGE